MKVYQGQFDIKTSNRNQMLNITSKVTSAVADSQISDGQVVVFCPHTTAAITINENADPAVVHDILLTLSELFPKKRSGYTHYEGNSDSHCKSSLIGTSERILLQKGSIVLGTWQGIYFCEFDGPRNRKFFIQVTGE